MNPSAPLPRRDFLGSLSTASVAAWATAPRPAQALEADARAPQQPLSDYLIEPGLTYLNTAALGLTPRSVLERTLEAWHQLELNPVRMAYGDGPVHLATDRVRERLAGFIGCAADELSITRSTTDAMNCLAQGVRFARGDRILTTDQEHEGGTLCWEHVARRQGLALDIVRIPLSEHDPGQLLQRIADALRPKTRLLSVSHVFSANGLRLPVAKIAALARDRGVLSVIDGAQALGQFDVQLRTIGCDAYAASGHKWLMGPKGTGVLYIRREAASDIAPVQRGDGSRFVSNATGIGALPLVVGLGAAIEAMERRGMAAVENRILELRRHLLCGLAELPRFQLVSPAAGAGATALVTGRLPPHIEARAAQARLREQHGVMVKRIETHELKGIRLSPHVFNTESEIDLALRALRELLG